MLYFKSSTKNRCIKALSTYFHNVLNQGQFRDRFLLVLFFLLIFVNRSGRYENEIFLPRPFYLKKKSFFPPLQKYWMHSSQLFRDFVHSVHKSTGRTLNTKIKFDDRFMRVETKHCDLIYCDRNNPKFAEINCCVI